MAWDLPVKCELTKINSINLKLILPLVFPMDGKNCHGFFKGVCCDLGDHNFMFSEWFQFLKDLGGISSRQELHDPGQRPRLPQLKLV